MKWIEKKKTKRNKDARTRPAVFFQDGEEYEDEEECLINRQKMRQNHVKNEIDYKGREAQILWSCWRLRSSCAVFFFFFRPFFVCLFFALPSSRSTPEYSRQRGLRMQKSLSSLLSFCSLSFDVTEWVCRHTFFSFDWSVWNGQLNRKLNFFHLIDSQYFHMKRNGCHPLNL